jgi:hypothetical protein
MLMRSGKSSTISPKTSAAAGNSTTGLQAARAASVPLSSSTSPKVDEVDRKNEDEPVGTTLTHHRYFALLDSTVTIIYRTG